MAILHVPSSAGSLKVHLEQAMVPLRVTTEPDGDGDESLSAAMRVIASANTTSSPSSLPNFMNHLQKLVSVSLVRPRPVGGSYSLLDGKEQPTIRQESVRTI